MRTDYSGQTVRLLDGINDPFAGHFPAGTEYHVEGYWDEITGKSWMNSNGNYACMNYAMRSIGLPIDNDVLYGKINGLGFLVHVTEIEGN